MCIIMSIGDISLKSVRLLPITVVTLQVNFSQDQYDEILRDFSRRNSDEGISRDGALEQTACDWLQHNQDIWIEWLPENIGGKTPIYIGGLFPITGPFWRQPGIVTGEPIKTLLVIYIRITFYFMMFILSLS